MAMDFFDQQDRAQRNTKRLIVLMVLGVLGIIISVHTVISTAVMWSMPGSQDPGTGMAVQRSFTDVFFNLEILGVVALGVVAVVSSGSLYKIKSLAGGGGAVARSLGGRRLEPGSGSADERKLLNVVEEMAIAAGIPVPPVYVMDGESGINAFAAGYEPTHAVIGVTRGAIEQLDRDELQGVIAHEFSHILNGDMRLNIQLIGILHGLLLVGIIGRVLIYSGGGRRGGKNSGNQIALVGLALMLIGFLGTLCGSIIKAAVSRQREYLADSSAVQFTRNPGGIAGALAKIGGLAEGSRMEHPRASELSHMYFGQGVRSAFGGIFATHPPLRERIERLDPSVLGVSTEPLEAGQGGSALGGHEAAAVSGFAGGEGGAQGTASAGPHGGDHPGGRPAALVVSLADALAQLGRPTAAHLAFVQRLLADIPADIRSAAHDPEGARALLIRLLLARDADVLARQRAVLRELEDERMIARVESLEGAARSLDPYARLPVLEIAIGTLSDMPEPEYRAFRRTLEALAAADGSLETFEWVVVSLVLRHLDPNFTVRRRKGRYTRLQGVAGPVRCLLSALAHAGHDDPDEADDAFHMGMNSLEGLGSQTLADPEDCGPAALDGVLDTLSHLEPGLKRQVLEACARTIATDKRVSLDEGELFRVIADWLDCPVPPLLPGQRVA